MFKHIQSHLGAFSLLLLAITVACVPAASSPPAAGEQAAPSTTTETSSATETDQEQGKAAKEQDIEIPASWDRLGKEEEIWIDTKAKEVIIAGVVCLDQGPLEMFICPEGTKEHESVISANALASQVHTALIALGADPGKSTSWDPEYRAAYGPTIEVTLMWHDVKTNKVTKTSAKNWIRDVETKRPMAHNWVFGGSEFWQDPETGEQIYYGDSGELICLSNFSTATIDVNVESSESNEGLLFEAFTENIPPVGTKVFAIIKPGKRIEPSKKNAGSKPDGDQKEPTGQDSESESVEPKNNNG